MPRGAIRYSIPCRSSHEITGLVTSQVPPTNHTMARRGCARFRTSPRTSATNATTACRAAGHCAASAECGERDAGLPARHAHCRHPLVVIPSRRERYRSDSPAVEVGLHGRPRPERRGDTWGGRPEWKRTRNTMGKPTTATSETRRIRPRPTGGQNPRAPARHPPCRQTRTPPPTSTRRKQPHKHAHRRGVPRLHEMGDGLRNTPPIPKAGDPQRRRRGYPPGLRGAKHKLGRDPQPRTGAPAGGSSTPRTPGQRGLSTKQPRPRDLLSGRPRRIGGQGRRARVEGTLRTRTKLVLASNGDGSGRN